MSIPRLNILQVEESLQWLLKQLFKGKFLLVTTKFGGFKVLTGGDCNLNNL